MADHDHANSLTKLNPSDLKPLNLKHSSNRLSTGGGFLSVDVSNDFKRKSFDTSNHQLAAILPTPKGPPLGGYQALKEKVIELEIEE